ncbi:feather keratin Cos2-3-like [Grus japonensis]|uniref:Keratin n=2 Tax=Gruidae TaxID=9109 RepID=A0ABC9Y913_GRUJA
MPASSKTDPPLAKAKPISASVITYLRRRKTLGEGAFAAGERSEKMCTSTLRDMSCYNQCLPCRPCGPTPLANSCNEPCVRQCQNSTVVIEPPAVVVTLPGPILSSFPQNTVVGSSTSAAVGSILSCDGVPITSGCCDLSGISSRYGGRRCLL